MSIKLQLASSFLLNFSAWPNELDNVNFEKLNRRIEHITRLRADTSKNYSEPFMVGGTIAGKDKFIVRYYFINCVI